jgi:hypothetical protein
MNAEKKRKLEEIKKAEKEKATEAQKRESEIAETEAERRATTEPIKVEIKAKKDTRW